MNPPNLLPIALIALATAACAGTPGSADPIGPAPPALGSAPIPAAAATPLLPEAPPVSVPAAGGNWNGAEYSDVLVAPGFDFEEEHSYSNLQDGSRMADLTYLGTMTPADASAWFLTSMPSAGWELTRYSGLRTKVLVFRKDAEEAMLSLTPADPGTRLRVMVHPALD